VQDIYANWKKEFSDKEWQKKFWAYAKAPCIMFFNHARAKLAEDTREGAQAIMKTHPQHWSRAWFRLGSNCDSVDNNMCESFNKWIVETKFFPIITMLEAIRRKVMIRIQEQGTKADRWMGAICPHIMRKLNTYITMAGYCHAISNGADKFEVKHFDNTFTVDLQQKTCSCRYWQLAGLPCCHAISSIYWKTNVLDDYIADCFRVEHFKNTYAHCLEPLEGIEGWPISDRPKLRAPGYIKMPGRPKKERTREPTEKPKATKMSRVGTVIRCGKCKGTGHNASTCGRRTDSAQSGGAQSAQSGPAHSNQPAVPRASQNTNVSVRVPSTQQDSNARKRKSYTALTHRSKSSDGTTTIRQQVIHLLVMFDKFTHQLSICSHVHIFYLCSLTEVL